MTLTESRMTLIAPAFAENCGILMCSEMSLGGLRVRPAHATPVRF